MSDCISTKNLHEDASPAIDQFSSNNIHERCVYFTIDAILPYLPSSEVRELCTPSPRYSIVRIKPEQTFSRVSCGKSIRLTNAVVVFREMNSCNYLLYVNADIFLLTFEDSTNSQPMMNALRCPQRTCCRHIRSRSQ